MVVLLPGTSSASTRGLTTSATLDSVSPHTRKNRLRMVACWPDRLTRSGTTALATISRISEGTPGTAYMTLLPTGQVKPGAVPADARIGEAPTGTSACL